MNPKIVILTPVYNDWKNLDKLLRQIDKIFKRKIKNYFHLVIINDCSSEKYNLKKYRFKMIHKITFISLNQNVGSQRAIAIGIRYLNNFYKNKNFKTIIIDSDGQDNPNIIEKMLSISKKFPRFSIAINRGQRKEKLWFRFFYEIYCKLIKIFYFKEIRFGNFSLINHNHLKTLSKKKELWSAFPPSLSMNISNLIHLTANREKRYSGISKMNFFGLLKHAFRVFSALKLRVFLSSVMYIFIAFVLFFENSKLLFFVISFPLIIFNLINFFISLRNKNEFKKSYKEVEIKFF